MVPKELGYLCNFSSSWRTEEKGGGIGLKLSFGLSKLC
jgi:hypothetical protein